MVKLVKQVQGGLFDRHLNSARFAITLYGYLPGSKPAQFVNLLICVFDLHMYYGETLIVVNNSLYPTELHCASKVEMAATNNLLTNGFFT